MPAHNIVARRGEMKKFCGRCKKELPAGSEYLLCGDCHKKVALAEDDREFFENSRVHWR